MNKYIDADKLIAEIRKLRSESTISESDDYYEYAKSRIIDIIDSLQQEAEEEWRKRNDEMQKTAREYRDSVIKHIEAKRALPSFQGQLLHDFKNELNTMKQILNIQMWPQTQYAIFEKVALAFASWGGYHFHPKESLSNDELEQEQPEVDLEKEITDTCRGYRINDYHEQELGKHDIESIARRFYELGLNARKER